MPAALTSLVDGATVRYLRHAPASPVLLVHTATAPNAVLHVLPFLPAELWPENLATVWAAVAAITAGYEPPVEGEDWTHDPAHVADEEVFGRACYHGDEHVLKFTDAALEVFARTQDERAVLAAGRARTLLPPMGTPA